MAQSDERALMKRLRRRFHNDLLNGSRQGGNYTGNFFCERAFDDPSAKLEQRDFLPAHICAGDSTLEIGWSTFRFGKVPFSRYYLATLILEGNLETQEVTFHIYEHRFSGMFALWRLPLWRKREITVPMDAIKGDRQNLRDIWQPGIDTAWSAYTITGRSSIERLQGYVRHLRIP